MALIDFTGFETLKTDYADLSFFTYSSYQTWMEPSVDTRLGTGRCLSVSNGGPFMVKDLSSPVQTIIHGFAFKSLESAETDFSFGNETYAYQLSFFFNANGSITVRRGTSSGVILGQTPIGTFNYYNWNYFELKATFSNTVGQVVVRVNGGEVINEQGIDTVYSGNEECTKLSWDVGTSSYWDDFYILDGTGSTNNDFLGDITIDAIVPTANGNQNDGVASVGSNWECVDEIELDDTDYVTLDAVNEIELYTMGDLPSTSYTKTIYGVKAIQWVGKTASGARAVKSTLRVNGANYEHPHVQHYLSIGNNMLYEKVWEVNPDDSNAWEEADVNALQAGIKVTT